MQKKIVSMVLAIVLLLAGIANDGKMITVNAESAEIENTEKQEISAKFYLLNSGLERPESNGTLSASNYRYAGRGKISTEEIVTKDDEKVKNHIVQAPDCTGMIKDTEEVIWYDIKKESDGWHVDGQVVSKIQPVEAKFYLLKSGIGRPQSNEKIAGSNYRYVGKGKVRTDKTIVGDDAKIKNLITEQPDCSSYITADEEVVWYSVKKESDGWHIDGEILKKSDGEIRNITVNSLQELKEVDVKSGDIVETRGYYSKEDGNGAKYKIVRSVEGKLNDGTAVRLNNGYCAQMIIEDGTVSIGQFGAIGDGKFDNAEVLKRVFDSPIMSKIVFPYGEYKVTDSIYLHDISNCEIIGNGSILFTDNDYAPTQEDTVLLRMNGLKNFKMRDLNVEGREDKYRCIMQFRVEFTENFEMDRCTFTSPEKVSLEGQKRLKYCIGSFRTAWHHIKVTNCEFKNLLDSEEGGLIGLNDIYAKGCDDFIFRNNKGYYKGHDEMIAIFTSKTTAIENVKFENNEFYALDSDNHPRVFCFSIGYYDGYKVDNIVFRNNKFEASSNFAFMYFGGSSNVLVENNTIIYKPITEKALPMVFKADDRISEGDVVVNKNHIILSDDISTKTKIEAICYGNVVFNNNILDAYMYTYTMFRKNASAQNNVFHLYKGGRGIGNEVAKFSDNTVTFYKTFEYLFNMNNLTLNKDSIIENNKIYCEFNDDQNTKTLLYLSKTKLNNHKVSFNNNVVVEKEGNTKNRLCSIDIQDTEPQQIEMKNNTIASYKNTTIKSDLSLHNIMISNNK